MRSRRQVFTTSAATSLRMSKQPRRDTSIEVALRSELHKRGFRYRIHRRPVSTLRREADIVFTRAKVAVFVDGCFWHGCPDHCRRPRSNADYWLPKIEKNIARDRDTDSALTEAGWLPIRIWEHEAVADAVDTIGAALQARSARGSNSHVGH